MSITLVTNANFQRRGGFTSGGGGFTSGGGVQYIKGRGHMVCLIAPVTNDSAVQVNVPLSEGANSLSEGVVWSGEDAKEGLGLDTDIWRP
eukprot:5113200-Pyramimonas_sp.AAC.1